MIFEVLNLYLLLINDSTVPFEALLDFYLLVICLLVPILLYNWSGIDDLDVRRRICTKDHI